MIAAAFAFAVVALAVVDLVSAHRSTCARFGHWWCLRLTPTRLYLSCSICQTETPGWQLFGVPDGCQRFTTRAR